MNRWLRSLAAKPYVVMPTVAVAIFGGWFAVQTRGADSASDGQMGAAEQVVAATVGPMNRTVSAQGTIAAADSDDLNFAAAGTVTVVNVKAGDEVAAGAALAAMDSPALRQGVADAEARVAAAQATLADDTASDASATRLTADRSNLTSAQNALAEAKAALAGATLTAPYAAKVSSIGIAVGDKLGADGQPTSSATGSDSGTGRSANNLGDGSNGNGASTAAISLVSLHAYEIDLGFDANDIGNVASGQAAKVTLSTATSSTDVFGGGPRMFFGGAGGPSFASDAPSEAAQETPTIASDAASTTGAVSSVSSVADASSGVASYPVVVSFTDDSGSFNVGATVQVEITVDEVPDAVQVPVAALVPGQDGGSVVTVRTASGDEQRRVETGLTADGMIEITSGLTEGEQVVISFGNLLQRGGE